MAVIDHVDHFSSGPDRTCPYRIPLRSCLLSVPLLMSFHGCQSPKGVQKAMAALASGPLRWLLSLPRKLFPYLRTWLFPCPSPHWEHCLG